MEFSINNDLIRETIEIISNVVPTKSSFPILTNILIKADDNKVVLIGNDNTNAIKKVLMNDVEIIESGSLCVPCTLLKNVLNKFKGNITHFKRENNIIVISNLKSKCKLNIVESDDYPEVDFKKLDNEFVINTNELKDNLNTTINSCSKNEKRPILTGVNFNINNSQYRLISTDSYRIARVIKNIESQTITNETNFTISNISLKMLLKISEKTKSDTISILWSNTNFDILFRVGDILFKTRFLDGTFPNTDKLFTSNFDNELKFNRELLLEYLDRLCIFSDTNDMARNVITFKFIDKELHAYGKNQIGNIEDVIECINIDDNYNLEIAFSAEYLIEALKTFNSENIVIKFNGNSRPFIVSDDSYSNEKVHLILPIKIGD